MKGFLKNMFAVAMATTICVGSMGMSVFAAETTDLGTTWYGDDLSVEIEAGTNGYTFRSVYPYSKEEFPHGAYEMSSHMVSADGENHDIPQTLMMVDAGKDYTWTPNGLYSFGESNYEVLYCCDAETGYENGIYYMRKNLEDSDYYSDEEAAHIRAIVMNSYPYVSLEEMKANLQQAGFAGAKDLTRGEIITAVQAAIWAFANNEVGFYTYSRTFNVPDNLQWGGTLHDFTSGTNFWWETGKRVFSTNDDVANRINSLIDYLKNLDAVYAEKNQIIISNIEIIDSNPVQAKENVYSVDLQVVLNNSGSGESDDIELTVYVDDNLVASKEIVLGTEVYDLTVEAKMGQIIKAVVSGTQVLPKGVYFYEPEGGRDVSQCLVGVAAGETDVYAEACVAVGERIINLTKTTTIEQSTKALDGIVFDIYYAGTVDEYTEFVKTYAAENTTEADAEIAKKAQDAFAAAKAALVEAGTLTCVETVTTDITGKAVYNITKDGQPDGIYLIIEREHPTIVEPLAPFVVAVPMTTEDGTFDYEVDIAPKNEVIIPDIKKDVTKIDNNEDTVNVGEEFTWIVRSDVPADLAAAKEYVITDTLDYRLTYAGDLVVKVEEIKAEANNSASSGNVLTEGTDYTLTVSEEKVAANGSDTEVERIDKFEVKLTEDGRKKISDLVGDNSSDYELRVYFNTIVDEDASMGEDIPNKATLKYTNSVNFEFEVESDEPIVYTCGINIKKYDAKETTQYLAGAEFMVARKATAEEIADENIKTDTLVISKSQTEEVVFVEFYDNAELIGPKVKTVTTDENGNAVIYGLEEIFEKDENDKTVTANYYLVEIKAPAGYNLLSYPAKVTLNKVSHEASNTVGVANSNAFELPVTGGIGTTIFTLVGTALVGSGVALVGKKRKEEE